MSQRAEKEETEFKVPEPLTLCVNNCGVTANPATNNMCQKCFNATTATSSSTVAVSTASVLTFTAERSPRSRSSRSPVLTISQPPTIRKPIQPQPPPAVSTEKTGVNRCCGCRKKVGLTGFRCRCGELFCAKHRYSDRHDCSYDYKTAGRDAIARENPVVKAAKIVRI